MYTGWLFLVWILFVCLFFTWTASSVWIEKKKIEKKINLNKERWFIKRFLPKPGMWIIFYELGRFLNPNFFNQCSTVSQRPNLEIDDVIFVRTFRILTQLIKKHNFILCYIYFHLSISTVQIIKTNTVPAKIKIIILTFSISSRRTDLISKSSKLQIYPEVCIGSLK